MRLRDWLRELTKRLALPPRGPHCQLCGAMDLPLTPEGSGLVCADKAGCEARQEAW